MGIIVGHPGDNVECAETRSATGAAQAFVPYGHKDTWPSHAFTVAAATATVDLSSLTKYDLGNAPVVHVYGASDTAGSSVTITPVWYDRLGNAMYVDDPIPMAVGPYRITASGLYVAQGGSDGIWTNSAVSIAFLVSAISSGSTWTITCVPTG